jgi:hypothetical protein
MSPPLLETSRWPRSLMHKFDSTHSDAAAAAAAAAATVCLVLILLARTDNSSGCQRVPPRRCPLNRRVRTSVSLLQEHPRSIRSGPLHSRGNTSARLHTTAKALQRKHVFINRIFGRLARGCTPHSANTTFPSPSACSTSSACTAPRAALR